MRRGRQFNSMTYGQKDPLTRSSDRHAILVDRRDLKELGLSEGDRVLVSSEVASKDATVRSGPCRRGHVQGFWPECNVLLERRYDPASGEPDYNAQVVNERQL
jgi:anaerobic selenocysteine-containing dehydrogenase